MSTQSDHELARAIESAFEDETATELDDAHELLEHEFTLDPDDDPTLSARVPKRPSSQPPPPPRRRQREPAEAGAIAARGPSSRGRSASGIFPLLAVTAALTPEQRLVAAEGELQRLRTQMRARDAYLRELEHAVAASNRQLSAAGLESVEDAARLLGRVRGQAFRIAELESDMRRLTARVAEPRSSFRPTDELQRVRGIGRRFAEQLNDLGYGSLARMATCTDEEISIIAKRLRITRERVVRERWVEQACLLHGRSASAFGRSAEPQA